MATIASFRPVRFCSKIEGLVSRQENVESIGFGCVQELAVLEPAPALVAGCENLV